MKKKLIILLLILALTLGGCAESGAPAPAQDPTPPPETAAPAPLPTPEPAPSAAPTPAPEEEGKLRISELMTKNRATLMADDGSFPDWFELENVSGEALSLEGWTVSDGPEQARWALPARTLAPGECCLIFAGGRDAADGAAPFALSEGESVCLFAPSGALVDELLCPELRSDESLARNAAGDAAPTLWATPGFANSDEGFDAFSEMRTAAGPLVISEVATANLSRSVNGRAREDWVELKNVSGAQVSLEGWYLCDGGSEEEPFALPARTLDPGETFVIVCGGDAPEDAPFSLDAQRDRLYLGTAEGIADYLPLHDLPVDGSCGRTDGRGGFFYFASPTPGLDNGSGCRMVSEAPAALTEDGVYEGVDALTVALEAPGRIYISTDGARPAVGGQAYAEPLSLTRTTVLRAVAVEEGKLPSRVVTLSYLINENLHLPALSLVTDDPSAFHSMYMNGHKGYELPGSLSLYENGRRFTQACGIKMSGSGSLELPKKSMAVMFRGCYGDGNLDCDVFDSGVSRYASLQLRAGEAYPTTIIQSDLFQDLSLDMSDSVLSQHSKHCILFVNGEYRGIYCLKEKFSEQYYASLKGVSKESVTVLKYPVEPASAFSQEVLAFCRDADLRDEEQYRRFCALVDVDSLIDWYLIEAVSGNTDIGGNLRLFRSSENGGAWSFALYDLDWAFTSESAIFDNLGYGNYYHSGQIQEIMDAAMRSEDFRDRILTRYAEVWDGELGNESILRRIDAYEELLAPEIPRERALWGTDESVWRMKMEQLREFIRDHDPQHLALERFCDYWGVPDETRRSYFGW